MKCLTCKRGDRVSDLSGYKGVFIIYCCGLWSLFYQGVSGQFDFSAMSTHKAELLIEQWQQQIGDNE